MKDYRNRNEPLTIAMWDFSWLKAHCRGGAYEDLSMCVAQAAERGYNTLRVDCFPSHILEGTVTFPAMHAQSDHIPCWGDTPVEHEEHVLSKVAELAEHCRRHDIRLGLDSWDKGHMIGHSDPIPADAEERVFTEFSKTWVKALRLMREEGILERAVWIAPMNEVPHFTSRGLESVRAIGARDIDENEIGRDSTGELDAIHRRINHWMAEAIADEVRAEGIPLCYSSMPGENYGHRVTDIYDVVDVHFMPDVIVDAEDQAALERTYNGPGGYQFRDMGRYDLRAWGEVWANACRRHYQEMLERVLRSLAHDAIDLCTTASGKRLLPVLTEGFGPCYFPDVPEVDWSWYKNYNADAARLLATLPFGGTTLSNYAEPLFRLWDDVDWHRNTNLYIRAAAKEAADE